MSKFQKVTDPKEERLRLQNLKLKLDIWKMMKDQGFTLDQAHEAMMGRPMGKLETPALEETFETTQPIQTEWKHDCPVAARVVVYPMSIGICHRCGTTKEDEATKQKRIQKKK